MKLVYVLHGRFPTEKAHGIQIAKLCEALGKRAELTLIALTGPDANPFEYYNILNTFKLQVLPTQSFLSRRGYVGFWIEKLFFLIRIRRIIRSLHPDSIYTRELFAPLFVPRISSVLEVHSLPRYLAFYTSFIKRFNAIVVKNRFLKEKLKSIGFPEKRIEVLPNAVDVEHFVPISKEDARRQMALQSHNPVCLYSGSFQAWKGVNVLIEAARLALDIDWYIVGGSEAEVCTYAASAPPNMHFLGRFPHDQIPAILAAADVLLLPNIALNAESEWYTSPLKLFEYMAARRPVVASALPSIQELLQDHEGFFFTPGDPAALVRTVRYVLANPYEASLRTQHAHERVVHNTWDAYAQNVLALLKKNI